MRAQLVSILRGWRQRWHHLLPVIGVLLAVLLLLAALLILNPGGWLQLIADPRAHRGLFVLLMTVLPVFGVSIVLFLVFIGLKFGILNGILVSGLVMLFHMVIAYLVAHSWLRPRVDRFVGHHHWRQPEMPAARKQLYAVLFVAIPGLPYAVKNYLLALAGLSFLNYLVICWSVQLALGIPFIVLGEVVKTRKIGFLLLGVFLLFSAFLAGRWLLKKFPPAAGKPL